ncbi:MAG: DM13 domain-containing protein [Micromonosporaceae bacterium]
MRKPLTWAVLAVAAAAGLWLFQPWKLVVDKRVNETLPTAAAPKSGEPENGPELLAEGTFVSHEHDTAGAAKVIELADGRRVLTFTDLDTSNGPDLRVWLTDQRVEPGRAGWHVFDDGKHVELGRLKGNQGDQAYQIPKRLDLADYRSVSIWCKRFQVSFGAAELTAP